MMQPEKIRKALRVRRNDTVVVLTGKSKGRTGRVLRVYPAKGRAIVEGVNFVRKHTKANPQKNIKGGILEREAPVDASNLMIICGECGKPSRVGHKLLDDGKKVRTCRRCNGILDK
jgi:large subunit ribosomal protein L24